MVGDILQPTHLLLVLLVALVVLGPKRLPEVARKLGDGMRDFKAAISFDSDKRDEDRPREEIASPREIASPGEEIASPRDEISGSYSRDREAEPKLEPETQRDPSPPPRAPLESEPDPAPMAPTAAPAAPTTATGTPDPPAPVVTDPARERPSPSPHAESLN